MQINTPSAIELGRRVRRTFGSWQKVREAAERGDDGSYRIARGVLADEGDERSAEAE